MQFSKRWEAGKERGQGGRFPQHVVIVRRRGVSIPKAGISLKWVFHDCGTSTFYNHGVDDTDTTTLAIFQNRAHRCEGGDKMEVDSIQIPPSSSPLQDGPPHPYSTRPSSSRPNTNISPNLIPVVDMATSKCSIRKCKSNESSSIPTSSIIIFALEGQQKTFHKRAKFGPSRRQEVKAVMACLRCSLLKTKVRYWCSPNNRNAIYLSAPTITSVPRATD